MVASFGHHLRSSCTDHVRDFICRVRSCTDVFNRGIAKNNLTFFLSSIFSVIGTIFLLTAASLWTVLIKKTQSINTATQGGRLLGITVSEGNGLFLTWAAFVCLFLSVIPNVLRCVLHPTYMNNGAHGDRVVVVHTEASPQNRQCRGIDTSFKFAMYLMPNFTIQLPCPYPSMSFVACT